MAAGSSESHNHDVIITVIASGIGSAKLAMPSAARDSLVVIDFRTRLYAQPYNRATRQAR